MSEPPLLRMTGVTKAFPGVVALDKVDLAINSGEVHVILGENGAGKSTLMKVAAGVYEPDSGALELRGLPFHPRSAKDARRQGVVMVMQEFNLIPDLSVAENICLLNQTERSLFAPVSMTKLKNEARRALDRLAIRLDPAVAVRSLSVAMKQMVEIARAMSQNARVLILDEPTAALSDREVARLFELINDLKADGVGVIYISHRFEEIYRIGDRVTVLRDGRRISEHDLKKVSPRELITDMAGRELKELYPRICREPGREILRVRGLSTGGDVKSASFALREKEVLGLAGLMGAGRTELGKAIFGAVEIADGEIWLSGRIFHPSSPRAAMRAGLAYLCEDRKEEGLFADKSVAWNLSITAPARIESRGLIVRNKERGLAMRHIRSLRISPPDPDRKAATLSGGAQQKVLLGKWLEISPRVLILDEPTRGIDVSAKVEIYGLIDEFVARGGAVILISSDLPELLAMSDRVVVMREGRVTGEVERKDFSQENIMALATGLSQIIAS